MQDNGNGRLKLSELVHKAIYQLEAFFDEERRREKNYLVGVPTGFTDLDILTGGLTPGIALIGARPELNMSDFALGLAFNTSETHRVLYFTYNSNAESLVRKLILMQGHLGYRDLREGDFHSETSSVNIVNACGSLIKRDKEQRLIFDDSKPDTDEIYRICDELNKEKKLDLVIIDNFQDILPTKGAESGENRSGYSLATDVRQGLDYLVAQISAPVLVLSELKKTKRGERINTSHLRDWAVLEYKASPILLLEQPIDENEDENDGAIPVNVRVENNRNGPNGIVSLTYLKSYCKYESAAKVSDEDVPRY